MRIWTSRPGLALVLLLAGCGGFGPVGSPPVREMAVTSDRVIVAGPDGFCIDPGSTRESEDSAFVLLGNCAVISNRRSAGQPSVRAVLTASISEADPEQSLRDAIPELDAFFSSDEGRQLLSRSGEADTVELLDSFHQGEVYFLRARDSSTSDLQGVSHDYWRSYLDVGDRIATLTVLGTEESPIDAETSLGTLRSFTDAVLAANDGVGGAPPVAAAQPRPAPTSPRPAPAPAAAPATGGALWNIGLFRRIMGN
ncbi:hypothetical protein [Nioella nitratireducens]|uniref:hypothetical protein n=1 Tax=Nioella nitratireducens TaxID=1287720 RepID=UPI0008FD02DE|nr:hypothetical protein [Nioella nitratireducens]